MSVFLLVLGFNGPHLALFNFQRTLAVVLLFVVCWCLFFLWCTFSLSFLKGNVKVLYRTMVLSLHKKRGVKRPLFSLLICTLYPFNCHYIPCNNWVSSYCPLEFKIKGIVGCVGYSIIILEDPCINWIDWDRIPNLFPVPCVYP